MDTTTDPSASTPPRTRDRAGLAVTAAAAVAVLAGGLLHLRTWDADYRDIPDGAVPGLWVVKVGFPLNAAASVLLAAALVAVALGVLAPLRRFVVVGALLLQVGSIAALVLSRGSGIFGWTEKGYEGDATQILVVEIVAVILLIGSIVLARTPPAEKS